MEEQTRSIVANGQAGVLVELRQRPNVALIATKRTAIAAGSIVLGAAEADDDDDNTHSHKGHLL